MKKKQYVLIDDQDENKLELHVAFKGVDWKDQILCSLSEESVVDLMKRYNYGILPNDFDIDIDVIEYINKKYEKPMLLSE